MSSRKLTFALRLGALAGAAALAACEDGGGLSHRSLAPIPGETLALMERAGTTKDAPMLIRAFKKEAELEVWKMRADGRYAHLKTFPMCRWSGQLGPKTRQGDRQVPEGFYAIAPSQMNPNSAYYLSFNVGYPNAYDRAFGRSGGDIMVHGACSSAGCFSMTDRQIAEIYAIARSALAGGQRSIQFQSFPFRMTAENLAKHRLDPNIGFWRNLKEGADHFEVTRQEPRVAVCGRRYVFDAASANGHGFDPDGACPPLKYDEDVKQLAAEKEAEDEAKVAQIAENVRPVRLVYQDGGQHPDFYARVAEVSRPETLTPPAEVALDDKRAGKGAAAKLAAKSPVVTMTAAKAAAQENGAAAPQESVVAAKHSESADGSALRLTALAPDHGATATTAKPPARPSGKKPAAGPLEQALKATGAAGAAGQ
jgi:murein L,D-transpeptidase YafK